MPPRTPSLRGPTQVWAARHLSSRIDGKKDATAASAASATLSSQRGPFCTACYLGQVLGISALSFALIMPGLLHTVDGLCWRHILLHFDPM